MNFYLVWSIEHNAWWRPASQGYTPSREEAGRYTFDQAVAIVTSANAFLDERPNEAMCPDWQKD